MLSHDWFVDKHYFDLVYLIIASKNNDKKMN